MNSQDVRYYGHLLVWIGCKYLYGAKSPAFDHAIAAVFILEIAAESLYRIFGPFNSPKERKDDPKNPAHGPFPDLD